MKSTPFQYMTYLYDKDTKGLENYKEKYHLLFDADSIGFNEKGKSGSFRNRDGTILQFPKELGGISGGSVWKIGNMDNPISEWKTSQVKLVAVQTSVYSESRIIKATRWIAVSTLIHEACPDLRSVMNIYYVS